MLNGLKRFLKYLRTILRLEALFSEKCVLYLESFNKIYLFSFVNELLNVTLEAKRSCFQR